MRQWKNHPHEPDYGIGIHEKILRKEFQKIHT
jgi:hypothetical protein